LGNSIKRRKKMGIWDDLYHDGERLGFKKGGAVKKMGKMKTSKQDSMDGFNQLRRGRASKRLKLVVLRNFVLDTKAVARPRKAKRRWLRRAPRDSLEQRKAIRREAKLKSKLLSATRLLANRTVVRSTKKK
jgi:hypothetical protein